MVQIMLGKIIQIMLSKAWIDHIRSDHGVEVNTL